MDTDSILDIVTYILTAIILIAAATWISVGVKKHDRVSPIVSKIILWPFYIVSAVFVIGMTNSILNSWHHGRLSEISQGDAISLAIGAILTVLVIWQSFRLRKRIRAINGG